MKRLFYAVLLALLSFTGAMAQDTWTVAGTAAALNGDESWSTTNTENDMVSTDGVNYTLTVADCTLEVGVTYEFKVVKNHAWDENYPSSNKTFTVDETAVYTVEYTFNTTTHEIGVTTTKTGEAGIITHSYTVAGGFTPDDETLEYEGVPFFGSEWSVEDTNNDMVSEDGIVYTLTKDGISLYAGTYQYKVAVDHAWGVSYPAENASFNVEADGEYNVVISFDATTKEVNASASKVQNTYTATFTDNRNWEEVYAYAFTTTGEGEESTTKEYLGAWPGTKLEKNDEGKYTVSIEATEAPAFIIFSNNAGEQTADLTFEDKSEYANEPIEVEPENAVIASVELRGEFNAWGEGQNVLQATDVENTYTGVLDLTDITADQEFKLVVKAGGKDDLNWIGTNQLTLDAPEGWVAADGENNNFTLKNSTTGYQTYTFTATWTASPDAAAGWTLKIEGKDEREVIEQKNTYTATFTDNRNWEEVYAYAFTSTGEGEETATKEYLGAWPGTKLEKNDEGKYTVSIEATEAPAFIIFNNNSEEQTADLAFEDKGEYANEPIEVEPENAVIASVELRGEFNEWSEGENVLQATDVENTYTGVLDLTDITADQEFKLVVKAEGKDDLNWIGTNQLTLDAPEGWVAADGEGNNFTLKNSTTGYQTYTFTATWTASPDAAAGWTLKIEGKDEREVIEQKNTYTATFTDNRNWEEVYAYAFTTTGEGEETATKEYLGAWPGTKLEKNDEGKYTVSIEATEAPVFIIFNNNAGEQTADLAFEDKGEYANEPIEVEPENAVIASVELRGAFNSWSAGQNMLTATDTENTYQGVLDLTDIAFDQEFKLVVNAEGGNGDIWLGGNQLTMEAPEGWIAEVSDGANFKLLNSTTGYQTYTFTATWTPSPDAAAGWMLKIEGLDEREEIKDAEITHVQICGATDEMWQNRIDFDLAPADEDNAFGGLLDLTESTDDVQFKLVVNDNNWIGTNQLTLDAPEGWVIAEGNGGNFTLTNSTTGYQTYTFTATWTPSPDPTAGWTLKIEGKDERVVEIPDAVITNVELRGQFNDWTAGTTVLEPTDVENVYEGTLDLTATKDDQEFKLVVNAEGVENDIWIGNGSDTQFDAPEGWIVGLEDGDWNYVLKNSTTGFQTYTVTATWTPSSDAGKGWTLKIEGKDERVVEIPDAVITNVELRGQFNEWTAGTTVLEPTDVENVYEGTLDLTATKDDQEFKLVVNAEGVENDIWIGNGSDTQFDAPEGWIVGLEDGDWNYVLKNSTTGYQTYTVTATWTPSSDAGKGWTLKIEGKDERIATGIEAWRTEFRDGHYYNLQGVRITNPKRGVYIHNGHKVVVK